MYSCFSWTAKFLLRCIFLSPCCLFATESKYCRVYCHPLDKTVKHMWNWGLLVVCLSNYFCCLLVNHWDAVLFSTSSNVQLKKQNWASKQTVQLWIKSRWASGFLFYCTLILPFGAHSEFPVNRIDWIGALCFPSPFSPYHSPVMSHVTIALPWVSLNLRAQWLHQRAILQRSPGINLAWKQLAMNLDCLEKFSAWQLPWSAVTAGCLIHTWTPHQESDGERGHPSVLLPCWMFTTENNSALNPPSKYFIELHRKIWTGVNLSNMGTVSPGANRKIMRPLVSLSLHVASN